jgi:hypothetical protein
VSTVEWLDLHPRPERLHLAVVDAVADGPLDGTSPESIARRVNAHDVYYVPWSL